jgi:hypothetical protein
MSGKTELRIFDEILPQVVARNASFVDISPKNSLSEKNQTIEFNIAGSESDYLDLNDSILYIQYNVKAAEGAKALAETSVVTPVNFFMNALFKDVSLYLNDEKIEGGQGMYPYKSTIETIFGFDRDAKFYQVKASGYEEDSTKRKDWIQKSRVAELVGPVRLDFLNQPKYLLPRINVKMIFERHHDSFALHGGGSEASRLTILDAKLYVRRVSVAPEVLLAHEDGLSKKNAIYPFMKSKVVTHTISTGSLSHYCDGLFSSSLLPKFVIVAFVSSVGYNGENLTVAPFDFKHFDVSSVGLYLDRQSVPFREVYKPNYAKDLVLKDYIRSIVHNFQHLNTNINNGISIEQWKNNYSFFTFNLTPDFDMKQCQMPRDGNLRLEVTFAKELASSINVIIYGMFDSQIQITKNRDIIVDHVH